jgi:integrase
MLWTPEEKALLLKQVKERVAIDDIKIGDRSKASIKYQIYQLGFYTSCWKISEITHLRKSVSEGKHPHQIELPGRTKTAIRNKLIRLGIWKTKKRRIKPWTKEELEKLRKLVSKHGNSPQIIYKKDYFPFRSYFSILHQIKRSETKGWN